MNKGELQLPWIDRALGGLRLIISCGLSEVAAAKGTVRRLFKFHTVVYPVVVGSYCVLLGLTSGASGMPIKA